VSTKNKQLRKTWELFQAAQGRLRKAERNFARASRDDLPDECLVIRDAETRCAKAVAKGDGQSVAEILELLRRVYALQKDLDDFQSEYYAAVGGLRKELSRYPDVKSWRDLDTQQVIALAEHILCLE
jgi:hypothetical protein